MKQEMFLTDEEVELLGKWKGGHTLFYNGKEYFIKCVTPKGFYICEWGGVGVIPDEAKQIAF